jgi:glycosyltransferase involved in cell wall biosynthesis
MNQQLTVLIPEIVLGLFLIYAFVVVLAANVYDIRQTIRRKTLLQLQPKFRRAIKPTISVIIYAQNNADTIKNCLDSIRRNRYKNVDTVIVDNKSTDDTSVVVRSYIQKYPTLHVRLFSKKQIVKKLDVLAQGYRKSQKGDLVLVLDASSIITKTLLKDCAIRFWADDNLQVLHPNINNINLESINLIYFRLQQLVGSMLNKFLSLTSKYQVGPNSGVP